MPLLTQTRDSDNSDAIQQNRIAITPTKSQEIDLKAAGFKILEALPVSGFDKVESSNGSGKKSCSLQTPPDLAPNACKN